MLLHSYAVFPSRRSRKLALVPVDLMVTYAFAASHFPDEFCFLFVKYHMGSNDVTSFLLFSGETPIFFGEGVWISDAVGVISLVPIDLNRV
nr:hypothetical protein [Tanacetum cinerariifolium]